MTVKQDAARADESSSQATKLAAAALEHYELPDLGLRMIRQMPRKLLFRVSSPKRGNFLLRMYASPNVRNVVDETKPHAVLRSEAGLRSQMLWLSDLRRTMRLPVSEPVAMPDGSLVGNAYTEDVTAPRKFTFVLLRWIPGEEKLNDFSVPEAFSLGTYIARLHRHAEQYAIPEDFVRPRWDWRHMFGASSPLWSVGPLLFSGEEMEVLRAKAERVGRDLQYIGEPRDAFGIIHSDLHPGNLLSHEGILYALDFDHCGWGYYMYDLTMSYMGLGRFKARSEEMGEALFAGYQQERPIPRDQLSRFEAFRTMCLAARVIPAFARLKNVPPGEIPGHSMWKVGGLQKNMEALVSTTSSV